MEAVRTGLRQIMRELLRARAPEEAVLLAWPLICGKTVAERSEAVGFADGLLRVNVPDATWRLQLSAFAPRYIAGFEELLGPFVKQIRFDVKSPTNLMRENR